MKRLLLALAIATSYVLALAIATSYVAEPVTQILAGTNAVGSAQMAGTSGGGNEWG